MLDYNFSYISMPSDFFTIEDGLSPNNHHLLAKVWASMRKNSTGLKVILAGFLCNFMVFGIGFSYGVFQQYYSAGPLKHYSDSEISIIGTVGTASTYLFGIFTKTALYYFLPRYVMLVGGTAMSLGLILAGSCTGIAGFALTQGVMFGIGSSFFYMCPVSCGPIYFSKYRAIAMGVMFSGTGFGGLVMANVTKALLSSSMGWRWALRTLGFMNLLVAVCASMLVKASPNSSEFRSNGLVISMTQLGSYRVWFQVGASLFQASGYLIPLIFMSRYGKSLGYSDSQGAALIGANNGINAVFKIVFGFAGDKLGRLNVMIVCSFISTAVVFALWSVAVGPAFLSFVVLYGVFSGAIVALLPATMVDLFGPLNYQAMSGLMYFGRGVGSLLGAPIAGLLIKHGGLKPRDYLNTIMYNGTVLGASTCCLIGLWFIARKMKDGNNFLV